MKSTRKDREPSREEHGELLRHDWTVEEALAVYHLPFPDLIFRAQSVHRHYHDPTKIQLCTLLSIKTGGCPEDCGYCPQSAHFETGVQREDMLDVEQVVASAHAARAAGSTRLCMGAAWRQVEDDGDFDLVLEMVRRVRELDLEVCCTLGMLTEDQARRLADAGLTAYNHNLDTGPGYYERVVTTRTYEDRLKTLEHVRRAGITVCCGGILGMGESIEDRLEMLCVLARLDPHPENVPINTLVRAPGTPLAHQPPVPSLEVARTCATARILIPRAKVRLSAGRLEMSPEAQALCFLGGVNSIFSGEKLLTTPNPSDDADRALLESLGLEPLPPSQPPSSSATPS